MYTKCLYKIFQSILFFFIITIMFSLNKLYALTNSNLEDVYLSNQKPTHIDPNYKVKSTFNFPDLILEKKQIQPIEKKYNIRKIHPKAKLD